jgi:hypothetical protein
VGGGPSEIQQAYSWGSHQSKLIQVLEAGHQEVSLSGAEMEALYAWIDLNGIYYPSYESAYPRHPAGRSPLTTEELNRLGSLTGVDFTRLKGHQRTLGPQLSFERPELSPCIQQMGKGKAYQEALQLIRLGSSRLAETPRADMEAFVPCEEHRSQLEKYQKRQDAEALNMKAIQQGTRHFESSQ